MPFSRSPFSGFPFDRSSNRDENLRSTLDDIAKRHPELAEHLDTFTHRASGPRAQRLADEPDFDDRFERPFREPFSGGFPFADRDRIDPEEFTQRFRRPRRDSNESQGTSRKEHHPPAPEDTAVPTAASNRTDSGNTAGQSENASPRSTTIHQSNTIDLGQKQEAVDDRGQRSMSAPPADKGQRYTSSINIPVNQPQPPVSAAMADHPQTDGRPVERIIPIRIEGRDEPVMPRKVSSSSSSGSAGSSAGFSHSPRGERIFGHRPEQFTQFLNRDNWSGFPSEEPVRKQAAPAQAQRTQSPARDNLHRDDRTDQPRTSAGPQPEDRSKPAPAPPENKSLAAIEQIQMIQKDVSALMEQAQKFDGKPRDKQYLYLDEMLTRNLIKLDNIDTQGQDIIRSSRKEAIKCIEKAIGILETKAALNQEEMEGVQKMQGTPSESTEPKKETSETSENSEENRKAEPSSDQTEMEVETKGESEEKPPENITTDFVLVEKDKEKPADEDSKRFELVDEAQKVVESESNDRKTEEKTDN
ncbi:unnamed protein product [Phaedon cochleariae]|uniref:BAG domain-containing protein n=1 Tax=Phaedon cochleariae TaxID=80249 RepID=A0A9P0DL68_PHACE|nr:unnamed protein product [Phaedon cochleariae]